MLFKSLPCPHLEWNTAQHLYFLSVSAAHVPVADFAGAAEVVAQLGGSADTAERVVGIETQSREPAAGFERQQNLLVGKLKICNCGGGLGSGVQVDQMLYFP